MKIGIIGAGRVFERKYLPAIGHRIDAVVETHPVRNREIAGIYNGMVFGNIKEAVDWGCDIWIITTPSGSHQAVAFELMKLGFSGPIIIEKPLDLDYERAKAIYDTARECDCIIHPICQNRSNQAVLELEKHIRQATFGEILHVEAFLGWRRTHRDYLRAPWKLERWEGGGVVGDHLIHVFDLWKYLFGPYEIVGQHSGLPHFDQPEVCPDTFSGLFKTSFGATSLSIFGSNAIGPEDPGVSMKIYGTHGMAHLYGFSWENVEIVSKLVRIKNEYAQTMAHKKFLNNTLLGIRDGRAPYVSEEDALFVINIISKLLEGDGNEKDLSK